MELFVYALLFVTSIVGLTFAVERGLALRWHKVVPAEVEAAVEACQTRDDVKMLRSVCQNTPAPLSRLLLHAADHLDWPREENADALQTRARYEVVKMERGLVVLEVIVGIAPLLGLVGTILGMMDAFRDVGMAGLGDATKLAQSISLILRATLMGLLIAIPALVVWSYFVKKVEVLTVEMETLCDEFLRRQYRQEEKS